MYSEAKTGLRFSGNIQWIGLSFILYLSCNRLTANKDVLNLLNTLFLITTLSLEKKQKQIIGCQITEDLLLLINHILHIHVQLRAIHCTMCFIYSSCQWKYRDASAPFSDKPTPICVGMLSDGWDMAIIKQEAVFP